MKYAVGMGSGAMIYIPSFIKIGSGIQNFIRRMHRHTDSMESTKAHFYFVKMRKVG
jgi:Uri superfamily endonuclease